MAKISEPALAEVRAALRRYAAEVESLDYAEATKGTYIPHAERFVKWLADGPLRGALGRK